MQEVNSGYYRLTRDEVVLVGLRAARRAEDASMVERLQKWAALAQQTGSVIMEAVQVGQIVNLAQEHIIDAQGLEGHSARRSGTDINSEAMARALVGVFEGRLPQQYPLPETEADLSTNLRVDNQHQSHQN